ncbi:chromo domain protein LHP1 [Tanacetum coccineum]|uniref:Chromo domain protein LHP1 n=1 Tax=Tanacetum coccineum TaxID=301880 RepID=A0ABQ5JB99_9ASTR
MFSFALAMRPPSYVILISGDGDFFPTFSALHGLGYTIVLIFQIDWVSQSCYETGHKRIEPGKRPLVTPLTLEHGWCLLRVANAAFWDMETKIIAQMGDFCNVETTRSPENKEHHMRKKLTADVLRKDCTGQKEEEKNERNLEF